MKNRELDVQSHRLSHRVRELELKLDKLLRDRAGRRTEKVPAEQLELAIQWLEDDAAIDADAEADDSDIADEFDGQADQDDNAKVPKRRPRRGKLPEHLPRNVAEHTLSESDRLCPECQAVMPCIGHDVSEVLDLIPARFVVREHRCAKYACGGCKSTVVTAPGPAKVIEKGVPSAGLVAHVLVNKYQDHLPLERQASRFEREGVPLAPSTLGGWVGRSIEQLRPLAERLWSTVGDAHLVQVDASGLNVLDKEVDGNIHRGTMWCYVTHTDHGRAVLFDYQRHGDGASGPWKRLADHTGYIQADAASVFDRIFNGQAANATEVGCWAHARRKFFDLRTSEPDAARMLQLAGKLFKLERIADAKAMSHEQRLDLRRRQSTSLLARILKLVRNIAAREPPASALAKAARYVINHHEALSRFLDDGRLPLTNNLDELQIRTLALGRKNYLFAGSHDAADRTAVIYTLLRTCAQHGVDPQVYLRDILTRLAEGWPNARIDELLPAAFAKKSGE